MEVRAYLEGFLRSWWLLGLVIAASFLIGRSIGNSQNSQYVASTSILLNGPLLATTAVPANLVQITTPASLLPQVDPPFVLNLINKAYPRLTPSKLQNAIVVSSDNGNQLLLISVTDISPKSAADIANFLAQRFVSTQTAELNRQINYYVNWFRQQIPMINAEIGRLNLEIQQLTPAPVRRGTPSIDPATQRTLATDQYQLDSDQRNLVNYQQALQDLNNVQPLFQQAYVILQPATASDVPITVPPSTSTIEGIAVAIGFILAMSGIIVMEYFNLCVRHKGELRRLAGLSVLAELPHVFKFERKRLLQLRPFPFRWRTKSLRFLCAVISAAALNKKGYTILLTSPRKKRSLAAIIAALLAYNGQRTLLIDTDSEKPDLHEQIKLTGPSNLLDSRGRTLSWISGTVHAHLFVLPATSMLARNQRMTPESLMALLPELQNIFDIIIIDAAPLDRADTHLFATHVAQTLLLVKKRRDRLKTLEMARNTCQQLKLNARCILLT